MRGAAENGSHQPHPTTHAAPRRRDLLLVGDSFNLNGFCFAFPNANGQSASFSEAIQWSKDTGILDSVTSQVPSMSSIFYGCAALFSTDVAQLDFVNLEGLFIISMIAVLIGVTIGLWEVPPPPSY